jgi:hypothetical protein
LGSSASPVAPPPVIVEAQATPLHQSKKNSINDTSDILFIIHFLPLIHFHLREVGLTALLAGIQILFHRQSQTSIKNLLSLPRIQIFSPVLNYCALQPAVSIPMRAIPQHIHRRPFRVKVHSTIQ